jgi:hypothetical protein
MNENLSLLFTACPVDGMPLNKPGSMPSFPHLMIISPGKRGGYCLSLCETFLQTLKLS